MDHASPGRPRWRMTLTTILVVALISGRSVMAGDDDPSASDDIAGFASIAELELTLGDDELVWQASELPAFPDDGHAIPFYAGFLYAPDAPLLVYRDGGRFTRLGAEKAMPVEDGDVLAPVALRDRDATFLALELLGEDEAYDPAGDPFRPEAGAYVLELARAEFAGDSEAPGRDEGAQENEDEAPVTLDDADSPVLLVVVTGEVELRVDDEDPEELGAGDVATVDAGFDLRWRGEEPGIVLAAALRLPEPDEDRDDEGDTAGPATPSAGGAGRGGGTGGDANSDAAPTPTPKPTEAPGGDAGGGSSADPPPPTGGGGSDSGGTDGGTTGSGDAPYEEGPGDGECLYCAPSDDGGSGGGGTDIPSGSPGSSDVFDNGGVAGPGGGTCYLADGGGDPDGDGLDNCGEAGAGTNPNSQDSDGDGLGDGFETHTLGSNPAKQDTDGDGLRDDEEYLIGTSPTNGDSDGDGVRDGDEGALGLLPAHPDTDGDGLRDGDEVYAYGTNPLDADTDDDYLWDGDEVVQGTDPFYYDSDGDCIWDSDEVLLGLRPLAPDVYPGALPCGTAA